MRYLNTVIGVVGAAIASLFGGWDNGMTTLIIFMGIDLITGGIILPGIFKKSPKTESGAIESKAFSKGLVRKGMYLVIVLVAVRLDMVFQTKIIRDAVVIAFIANESISIVENAGLMGIPIPKKLTDAIGILKQKSE